MVRNNLSCSSCGWDDIPYSILYLYLVNEVNEMKKQIILMAIALLMVFSIVQNVSADISFWRDIIIDKNTSVVRAIGVYNFQDNSKDFLGKYRPIPIAIMYDWDNIPYNISQYYPQYPNAYVDWCNLTISHDTNEYDSDGNFNGTTTETFTYNVSNQVAGNNLTAVYMKHSDVLRIFWDCHYTNTETIFQDGVLFADWGTFFPAFTCNGCEDFKLEELSNEIKYNEANALKEIGIYEKFQSVVKLNFNMWLYGSWIIKIGLLLASLSLIFLVGYVFYSIVNSMARRT